MASVGAAGALATFARATAASARVATSTFWLSFHFWKLYI